ncbi:MAG: hypothetical protein Q8930_10525 [Bacillota bacterium]|nr:hypothetical protein [Bacillota bacterium]
MISKGRIVMASIHIIEDIEYYCSYLLVMKEGRLIYKGTRENFIKKVEGLVWEADSNKNILFNDINRDKVITTLATENLSYIRYISEEPLTPNSKMAEINLKDAYIAHSMI